MKELPILFTGALVREILAGRKTQTRRLIKPQPSGTDFIDGCDYVTTGWSLWERRENGIRACRCQPVRCPYGQPGDRLWVRETWRPFSIPSVNGDAIAVRYAANDTLLRMGRGDTRLDGWKMPQAAVDGGWVPSIHMPRWASRLTLEVESVRVERLQEITEEDALAEGIPADGEPWSSDMDWFIADRKVWAEWSHRQRFEYAWDRINGDRATWASNPWVWCVGFKRVGP